MTARGVRFELVFSGEEAESSILDFYDAAQAMIGFQRSLALTTHLVINSEIITQAPSLRGARIFSDPVEAGSWRANACIVIAGLYAAGQTPTDTPVGHLISSVYDLAVHRAIGVHVDYEKSLGELYEDAQKENAKISKPQSSKFDSLTEKIEAALRQIHRPIVASQTASKANISSFSADGEVINDVDFDIETYANLGELIEGPKRELEGYVSSYNINTHKGRIFLPEYQRTVPFSLRNELILPGVIREITRSLSANALDQARNDKLLRFHAIQFFGLNDRIKSVFIVEVLN